MEIDREAARTLELDYDGIKQMAEEIEVDAEAEAEVDKFLLLSTALVLIAVPLRFAEEATTWRLTLRKSKEWLEQVIDEARPRLRGRPLMEWVEEFVRR